MKRNTKIGALLVWGVVWSMCSMPVLAMVGGNPVPANTGHATSNRLIVKFKASRAEQVMSTEQRYAEMSRPLAADVIQQLQFAAGVQMSDLRATGTGAHVVSVNSLQGTQSIAQAAAAISKLPNVEYAEEDVIETIQAVPNDTYYSTAGGNPALWGMWPVNAVAASAPGGTGSYGADFQTAWDTSTGAGVVVAVVDTGITAHPDIVGPNGVVAAGAGSNLVSSGYNFITDCRTRGSCAATTPDASAYRAPEAGASDTGDFLTVADCTTSGSVFLGLCTVQQNSSWHGTHVAGTIAAIGNNSRGVIGGAYGARILPVRALGKGGGYSTDVSDAIMWAAGVHPTIANPNPAKVINLSLGSISACSTDRRDAINAAVAAGAVVVVAAGNEEVDVANAKSANCPNVISVAAVARDGSRAYYSNFSSPTGSPSPVSVTLAAPGGNQRDYPATFDPGILSTINTGSTTPSTPAYIYYQGTSMATPHVSAAVALMLSRNATLTPAQVKAKLTDPTSVTAFPSFVAGLATRDCALNANCGAGILNAALAVNNSFVLAADVVPADFGNTKSGGTVTKTVTWTNVTAGSVTVSGSASITGTHASFFAIESSSCDSLTIASGGTCAVTLRYAPTSSGNHSAVLVVPSTPLASGVSLVGTVNAPPTLSGSGGCAIMPFGANPDVSLLLALLAVGVYWLRRRIVSARGTA